MRALLRELLRKATEFSCVALGVYALAALGSLKWPIFVGCVLLENQLMGLWFMLKNRKAAPVLEHRSGQGGKISTSYRLQYNRIGGKLQ